MYLQSLQETERAQPASSRHETKRGVVQHFFIVVPGEEKKEAYIKNNARKTSWFKKTALMSANWFSVQIGCALITSDTEAWKHTHTHTHWATVTPAVIHTSFTRLQTHTTSSRRTEREQKSEKEKKTYSSVLFREEIGTIVQPFLLWRNTEISERTIGIQRRPMLVITRCIGEL